MTDTSNQNNTLPATGGAPPIELGQVADALHELSGRFEQLEGLLQGHAAPSPLLNLKQAADRLNVCTRTVESLVALGDIPVTRIGPKRGARRFAPDALDAYVRRQTRTL